MKVDFENKVIVIEHGDTFKKLKKLVEQHNLADFELKPKDCGLGNIVVTREVNPYTNINPYNDPNKHYVYYQTNFK